jgi:hypothetical protein
MPHFEHTYETAGTDMAVIAIDVGFNDSIDAIKAYRKRLGITMPIVFDDGTLGAAFHLRVTPTHIVIGRDGRIQYIGHLADGELDAALTAARAPAAARALAAARAPAAGEPQAMASAHCGRGSAAEEVPANHRWAALRVSARRHAATTDRSGIFVALVRDLSVDHAARGFCELPQRARAVQRLGQRCASALAGDRIRTLGGLR